jgi:uncharacterized protein (TIGR02598 family)
MPQGTPPIALGRYREGFSLVEVVLAVGVAAFALVTLMALLPAGLNTFKGSMNTSIGTQIAERVFNDLQVTDFSDIETTNRFFDEQGTELPSTASNSVKCIYWVQVNIGAPGSDSSTSSLMGNNSTNLYTVKLYVARNPGGSLPTVKIYNSTNPNTQTFTMLIGRSK